MNPIEQPHFWLDALAEIDMRALDPRLGPSYAHHHPEWQRPLDPQGLPPGERLSPPPPPPWSARALDAHDAEMRRQMQQNGKRKDQRRGFM